MDLSLARLNQILVIARAGSFSRAAAELHLSQPALSRSVALLEQRYGVQIFERRRTGVMLTSSGAQIVVEMEKLVRNARALDHNLHLHGKGEAGHLELGIGPVIASIILSEIGIRVFASRPKAKLRTLIRPTDVLVHAMIEDEIELFIAPKTMDIPAEIQTETVGRMSAAFIVRSAHPLAGRADVDLGELLTFPLAGPAEITWAMRMDGPTQGAFVCDNIHVIREVVTESDLVWICPLHSVAGELSDGLLSVLRVARSPLTEKKSPFATIEVVVGTLAGRTISPLATEIIALCKECFSRAPHIA